MYREFLLVVFIFSFSMSAFADTFNNTNLSSGDMAYWQQPYRSDKNEILFVDIKSSPETLRALVPEPLKPNTENIIRLYIGRLNIVEPGESTYLESGLVIPVTYYVEEYKYEKIGYYFPILYLDKVIPIIAGREVYGFPKYHADIEFTRNEKFVHGVVKRNGEIIIDLKFEITEKAQLVGGVGPWETFVYKRIPSANLKNEYDVRQIVSIENTNVKIDEQYFGKASLKFGSTEYDPLGKIPVLEVTGGTFEIGGFTMNEGKVLHDYLMH